MSIIWDKVGIIGGVYNGTNTPYKHNSLNLNDIDYTIVKIITFYCRGVALQQHP